MWQRNALLEKVGVLYLLNLRSTTTHLFQSLWPFLFFRTKALEDVSYFELAFQIKDCLQRATFHSNSQVGIIFHEMDTLESPPTYFRTDKFTNAFQEIVDAYGYVQRCQSQHESEILPLFQIMSRYITKTMHLEMPKRPIIWNGGSTCSDSFIFYLPHWIDCDFFFVAVLLDIKKLIQLYILLWHSHFFLLLCLEIGVMGYVCY